MCITFHVLLKIAIWYPLGKKYIVYRTFVVVKNTNYCFQKYDFYKTATILSFHWFSNSQQSFSSDILSCMNSQRWHVVYEIYLLIFRFSFQMEGGWCYLLHSGAEMEITVSNVDRFPHLQCVHLSQLPPWRLLYFLCFVTPDLERLLNTEQTFELMSPTSSLLCRILSLTDSLSP